MVLRFEHFKPEREADNNNNNNNNNIIIIIIINIIITTISIINIEIRTWWDALSTLGPDFGYFPNDRKCWIIAVSGSDIVQHSSMGGSITLMLYRVGT